MAARNAESQSDSNESQFVSRSQKSDATRGRAANGVSHDESLDLHVLLHALQAMRNGDFSVRLPSDLAGLSGKVADTFNEIVVANERMAQQLEFVGEAVGRQGKTRQRVKLGVPGGAWEGMESSVNSLIDDLLSL